LYVSIIKVKHWLDKYSVTGINMTPLFNDRCIVRYRYTCTTRGPNRECLETGTPLKLKIISRKLLANNTHGFIIDTEIF